MRRAVVRLAWVILGAAVPAWGQAAFDFERPDDPLRSVSGSARIGYHDPDRTGWGPATVVFARASALGLPPAPVGGDPRVMSFPATTGRQGFLLRHLLGPSGATARQGLIGDATLVFDVLWPSSSDGRLRALVQADPSNGDDAELFVEASASGGVGIPGRFDGAIEPGRWHRIVAVIRASASGGTMRTFIDGRPVGEHAGIDARWALGPIALLFADNDGGTGAGVTSGVAVDNRAWGDGEVAALGGVHAGGPLIAGDGPDAPDARDRIIVIGHRGDSGASPENTLTSIRRAFDAGADMVEVDIRLTSDGVPILMHDDTLDRTTDGTGPTASRPWSYIRTLDAGSWFGPAFAGERVPTLAEAMREAKGRGVLYLDIKVGGMGPSIASAMAEAGVGDADLWLWVGTSTARLSEIRAALPGGRCVWGEFSPSNRGFMRQLASLGVVAFDLSWPNATAAHVAAARDEGLLFSVYTVNDEPTMRTMLDLGIDAMETDFPARLDGLLRRRFSGDVNGDGVRDIFDVLGFFGAFGAGDHRADVAEPRLSWDVFDIVAYFASFGS